MSRPLLIADKDLGSETLRLTSEINRIFRRALINANVSDTKDYAIARIVMINGLLVIGRNSATRSVASMRISNDGRYTVETMDGNPEDD